MDYATIHTDVMVNNPNLFAFMPYDPISNTTGTFSSGRFYTNHELDMPLNFGNVVRFVPYVQGQAVGWTDQLGGGPLGPSAHRRDGPHLGRRPACRAEVTAWKKYPNVESELLNVHGLNNKISLFVDARAAYSNQQAQQASPSRTTSTTTPTNTYAAIRPSRSFTGGHLADPLRPAAPDLAPDVVADHRHDRRAGVDQYGAAGRPPAAADEARARSASGGSSIT